MHNNLDSKKYFISKYFAKFFLIIFYILVLAFFLYLPMLSKFIFKKDNVINVYTFTDMISYKTAQDFEKQTGIRVNLKYFDTNEELYAKFRINNGKGYDLITPSDYLVDLLRKDSLLANLDLNKLSNFNNLDKRLMGHYFDPNNNYSIPYFWSMDGIIYKTDFFKNIKVDWDLVFNKPANLNFKICMLDSARESVMILSNHILNKIKNLSNNDYLRIKQILMKQSSWVEIYMLASLQYYLLAGVVPLAVTSSAFAKKILEISKDYTFVIPKTGALLIIDNLAIPNSSNKKNLTIKFIDFLISKEVMTYNSNLFGYNPSNKKAYSLTQEQFIKNRSFLPIDEMFEKMYILHNELDIKKIEKLWLETQLSQS